MTTETLMDLLTAPMTAADYRHADSVSPETMAMIHTEAHRENMARFEVDEREFERAMRRDRRSDRGSRW